MIVDSGNRTEFTTGAVRDVQEGKGRCDLLPLSEVAEYLESPVIERIGRWQRSKDVKDLEAVFAIGVMELFEDRETAILELSVHFEEGCKKYGERNWEKGIPVNRYIDSAIRHYLKHLRGDKDERHDRAFLWNIICCIWTIKNKPELNDYEEGGTNENN